MTRIFLPKTPPSLLISSTAMSMPFFVEIPNVAVVPVNEPNSPTTISVEFEFELARVHEASAIAATQHNIISHGMRFMNPPCRRIPEEKTATYEKNRERAYEDSDLDRKSTRLNSSH